MFRHFQIAFTEANKTTVFRKMKEGPTLIIPCIFLKKQK